MLHHGAGGGLQGILLGAVVVDVVRHGLDVSPVSWKVKFVSCKSSYTTPSELGSE